MKLRSPLRSGLTLMLAALSVIAGTFLRAYAAERITLRNGFELDCARREVAGDRVRLYLLPATPGAAVGQTMAQDAATSRSPPAPCCGWSRFPIRPRFLCRRATLRTRCRSARAASGTAGPRAYSLVAVDLAEMRRDAYARRRAAQHRCRSAGQRRCRPK